MLRSRLSACVRRFSAKSLSVVIVWGNGSVGQLGLGPFEVSGMTRKYEELGPRVLQSFLDMQVNVTKLALGQEHSAAVDDAGKIYVWGRGEKGQLGLGDKTLQVDSPTLLESLSEVEIVDISCGTQHTAAVDKQGRVFTWGFGGSAMSDNALGLGPSTGKNQMTPALVETFIDDGCPIASVDCGDAHTVALSVDGEVWTWGRGDNGRLGNGELISLEYPEPMEFFDKVNIIQVAAGRSFTLALREDGRVFGWGKNNHFQLGSEGGGMVVDMNTMESFPVEITGFNGERIVKIASGKEHGAAISESGRLFIWGSNLWVQPREITALKHKKVIDVSCGDRSTLVIADDGTAFTFGKRGMGSSNYLGHYDTQPQAQPKQLDALSQAFVMSGACGGHHMGVLARAHTIAADKDFSLRE
ncbi:regulator of chromosome condensation (RCC1) [Thraustotheca clavata]|uniref:Regulator of chromosome condensation (RCC1) n=1 Tax=Thraustotheca clavata TaxID=74557 RepID=A0A1V9ZDN4_9STRA|nr:regulator of chromosome condensation (RCC1) [Thraustotheca clavata]